MSIQPTNPQEHNSHTWESSDPAHHSDHSEYEEEVVLQEGIKNPTAPQRKLGDGDIILT